MGTGMNCTKCRERERAKGQRWCSRCRKGKGGERGENAGVLRENGAEGENKRSPSRLALALARVEELEAEVARLKRELAKRPPTGRELSLGLRSPLDAVSPGQGAVIGKATVTSQTAVQELTRLQPRSGVECIHGGWVGSCRVLGCQAKR